MPTFETPGPISVELELGVGEVHISASERSDTVVEVRPSDETDESDLQAAAQTRVEYAGGLLRVTGPKRVFDFSRKTRSVAVSIEMPSGSGFSGHLSMGDIRCTGRLGECRVKTTGNIWLERTGPLRLHTGAGHVVAGGIAGDAEISTGSGRVQVGTVDGAVEVKNSNGQTTLDTVAGDVRVRNANGDIGIDRAGAGVDVKTSCGSIRLGEVARGSVVLGTAAGDLEVGIAEGAAAWLDLSTGFGHVRNGLEQTGQPDGTTEAVEVRGRTSYGDITIHRS